MTQMNGLVIKNTGYWYTVLTDEGSTVDCKIKGNFRLRGIRSTNPVAVGDHVTIQPNSEGTAFITEISDRRNYIIRKSQNLSKQSHIIAANVDQAVLVVTVNYPETSLTFIDRFLASAEAYSVPVILAFNKTDILSPDERHYQQMMADLYETIGYKCLQLSAVEGTGMDALRAVLDGKITLFSGNSGVGKSTILNALLPGVNLRTSEISDASFMAITSSSPVAIMCPFCESSALIRVYPSVCMTMFQPFRSGSPYVVPPDTLTRFLVFAVIFPLLSLAVKVRVKLPWISFSLMINASTVVVSPVARTL